MSDEITIRCATTADLPAILALLADDAISATREVVSDPIDAAYLAAFAAIERDPNQRLLVATFAGAVVGCLQLTFIPGLSRRGLWRGQIESVRVATSSRGRGVGRAMIEGSIAACRAHGCGLVQLTTDKARPDALHFYQSLGFVASHEGLKLAID